MAYGPLQGGKYESIFDTNRTFDVHLDVLWWQALLLSLHSRGSHKQLLVESSGFWKGSNDTGHVM